MNSRGFLKLFTKKTLSLCLLSSIVFFTTFIPQTSHAEIPESCYKPEGEGFIREKVGEFVENFIANHFGGGNTGGTGTGGTGTGGTGTGGTGTGGTGTGGTGTGGTGGTGTGGTGTGGIGGNKVPVYDNAVEDQVKSTGNDIGQINITSAEETEKIKGKAEASKGKELCLDDLAKKTGEKTRNDIIKKTAQWASEGNTGIETINGIVVQDGTSFFEESRSYYNTLEDVEVHRFLDEIQEDIANNPSKNPFSQTISQNIINERTNDTNQFTLDEEIGDNWQDFETDFTVGGWDGWNALTQNPNNTPTGSYLVEKQELQERIDNRITNEERDRTQGFIPQRECNQEVQINGNTYCNSYSITTPGDIIEQQLASATNSSLRQLELGDETSELPKDKKEREIFQTAIDTLSDTGVTTLASNIDSLSVNLFGDTFSLSDSQILYFILQKTGYSSLEALLRGKYNMSDKTMATYKEISKVIDYICGGGLTQCLQGLGYNSNDL